MSTWEAGEMTAFMAERLDEDEAAAKGAPWELGAGQWPFWMEFMSNERPYIEAAEAYRDRFPPARALRAIEADRRVLDAYGRLLKNQERHAAALAEWNADVEHEERTGRWEGAGDPGSRSHALLREGDYLVAMIPLLRALIEAKAAVWSDHPDYRG